MPPTPHNDLHPTAAITPRRKAAKRATAICASNIVTISRKKSSTAHSPETGRNSIACAARILLALNLVISNAAIYWTLVVQGIVLVGQP
jgi:hypothetical protein